MFDEHNEIVKVFRTARDRYRENDLLSIRLKLIAKRPNDTIQ